MPKKKWKITDEDDWDSIVLTDNIENFVNENKKGSDDDERRDPPARLSERS